VSECVSERERVCVCVCEREWRCRDPARSTPGCRSVSVFTPAVACVEPKPRWPLNSGAALRRRSSETSLRGTRRAAPTSSPWSAARTREAVTGDDGNTHLAHRRHVDVDHGVDELKREQNTSVTGTLRAFVKDVILAIV